MVKVDRIEHVIELPEGVSAQLGEDGVITVNGPKGSLSRAFVSSEIHVFIEGQSIILNIDVPRRKQKALIGTWNAHLKNMVKGVNEGFTYTLKAFYSHFPMTLSIQNSMFTVNNYFGEKVPRTAVILDGVNVKIDNKVEIIVSGIDKESVGQTAANIERCTKVKNRDRRVFQDGIYLINKE
ncbi:MAG: 50S ribosomal protein L6 [archaeon]|nr:50S ribosomal protein L6 [archaeon]MDA0842880.1 50S ribosomal protein L6 [archaeon]MDA1167700.1 50S ribosomal protein L6 [archaeon]